MLFEFNKDKQVVLKPELYTDPIIRDRCEGLNKKARDDFDRLLSFHGLVYDPDSPYYYLKEDDRQLKAYISVYGESGNYKAKIDVQLVDIIKALCTSPEQALLDTCYKKIEAIRIHIDEAAVDKPLVDIMKSIPVLFDLLDTAKERLKKKKDNDKLLGGRSRSFAEDYLDEIEG